MLLGQNFQGRFTQFLMATVAVLGLASTAILLSDPMSQYNVDAETQSIVGRTEPASAPTEVTRDIAHTSEVKPETKGKKRQIIVNIDCNNSAQHIITDTNRLRLSAKTCQDFEMIQPLQSKIKNETNGFIATLFVPKDQLFATDFINLNEGENKLSIRLRNGNKHFDTVVKVTRTPASH